MSTSSLSFKGLKNAFMIGMAATAQFLAVQTADAQTYPAAPPEKAPQDTVTLKRSPAESLTKTLEQTERTVDARTLGIAVLAAGQLLQQEAYDAEKGLALTDLIKEDDLEYLAAQGSTGVATAFHAINAQLAPSGKMLAFPAPETRTTKPENALALKELNARLVPAGKGANRPQWKENVYQSYKARGYGSDTANTLEFVAVQRLIKEAPDLTLNDDTGGKISLGAIIAGQAQKFADPKKAMREAVRQVQLLTVPGEMPAQQAAENYKAGLDKLIDLHDGDVQRIPSLRKFAEQELPDDLAKGKDSKFMQAMNASRVFDSNVPGNTGKAWLTRANALDAAEAAKNAREQASEIVSMLGLHYGLVDGVAVARQVLNGQGDMPVTQAANAGRLDQMGRNALQKQANAGVDIEQQAATLTVADVAALALARPEIQPQEKKVAYLTLNQVGEAVVNLYSSVEINEMTTTMLAPRFTMRSRHVEHQYSNDPDEAIPDFNNALGVVYNGVEAGVEADILIGKAGKMASEGRKPFVHGTFGINGGLGKRTVGAGAGGKTPVLGKLGLVIPQYSNNYNQIGGTIGIAVGAFTAYADFLSLSAKRREDPLEQFVNPNAMHYTRYGGKMNVAHLQFGKKRNSPAVTLGVEMAFESTNIFKGNVTGQQNAAYQVKGSAWQDQYDRAHPGGKYDRAIALKMIEDGATSASVPSSGFAQLNAGVQAGRFHVQANVGKYQTKTIQHSDEGLINWGKSIFNHTIHGNWYAGVNVQFALGNQRKESHAKAQSMQSTQDGQRSAIEESFHESKQNTVLRNRAVFTNKNARGNLPQ